MGEETKIRLEPHEELRFRVQDCPQCKKRFAFKLGNASQYVNCPHCKAPLYLVKERKNESI